MEIIKFAALTLDFLGKAMLGVGVILVHEKVKREHKIDEAVLKEMGIEQWITITGIVFISMAYVLNIIRA